VHAAALSQSGTPHPSSTATSTEIGEGGMHTKMLEAACDIFTCLSDHINESEYIYRVSQEECSKIRGVPYVKVADITPNAYVQS
jgi:hypothetical protein